MSMLSERERWRGAPRLRGDGRLAARRSRREDVDIVIVATTHDSLAQITLAAVEAGKHVWSRSRPPAAWPSSNADRGAARATRRREGRLQPPLPPRASKARELVAAGALGAAAVHSRPLRSRRPASATTASGAPTPPIGGRGAARPGRPLIDLSRWFLGPFTTSSWLLSIIACSISRSGENQKPL